MPGPWNSGQPRQIPTFPAPLLPFFYSQLKDEKKGSRPLRGLPKPHSFKDHSVLEWIPVSGSFPDWNMLQDRYGPGKILIRPVAYQCNSGTADGDECGIVMGRCAGLKLFHGAANCGDYRNAGFTAVAADQFQESVFTELLTFG